MAFDTLPNELVLLIATHLRAAPLNCFLRSCRRFADLLTAELYNAYLKRGEATNLAFPEPIWECVPTRKSEWITEYLLQQKDIRVNISLRTPEQCRLHTEVLDPLNLFNAMAIAGNIFMLKTLLGDGWDIDRLDYGWTALHYAAAWAQDDVIDFLIDSGADIWATNLIYDFPSTVAVLYGNLGNAEQILDWAREEKCGGEARDSRLEDLYGGMLRYGKIDVVKSLLYRKAPIMERPRSGRELIWHPIESRNYAVTKELIRFMGWRNGPGADPATNVDFNAILQELVDMEFLEYPMVEGFLETVEILLKHGVDISTRNAKGTTLLHSIITRDPYYPLIDILIEAGADPLAEDDQGRSALRIAASARMSHLWRRLLRPLDSKWSRGHVNSRLWRAAQPCIEKTKVDGETMIDYAPLEILGRLSITNKSALEPLDARGRTALHILCEPSETKSLYESRLPIVKCLVDNGANPGAQDCAGDTPAHHAVRAGSAETVEVLFKKRCDAFLRVNRKGESALQNAVRGDAAMRKLLDDWGVDRCAE
ncbi:hypothetical protein PRK78_000695 [Emydomyces testavorans]|uniref:Ankyrin n=1 Tax=Emydomyces testavorans TaxID=2070801 RepID=A0AAF0DCE7_9EURO|nr:hypothetical protein PRK78_000695 [Emydomyces testavorans]